MQHKHKVICLIIVLLVLVIGCQNKYSNNTYYVASNTINVKLYNLDYTDTKQTITRGIKLNIIDKKIVKDNKKYSKIKYHDKEYLLEEKYITTDKNKIILEDIMYVRTPVTFYEEGNSPKILGLIKKGEKVDILGYDKLLDNGIVNKYHIKYNDKEGYVYGKYLVNTKEEALAYYDDELQAYHASMPDNYGGGSAGELDYYPFTKGDFSHEGNTMPSGVRALYLNSAAIRNVDQYIDLAKKSNINAFVVDIKDNTSPAYESKVMEQYSKTNYNHAISSFDNYKSYIKKLKDAGFYVIGRITVFKDSYYIEDHPDDAISTNTGEPFSHNGSFWPSAYNRDVWQFNVELAREAVTEMGFNEIQFDYVRFPDGIYPLEKDGTVDLKNTYDESKAQAIQTFVMYATDQIHEVGAYFSVDVFGESVHNYMTSYGQYWPAISNVVDVISAMPYPDHFNAHQYGIEEVVWTNPYHLLTIWGEYARNKQAKIPTPAIGRTWIQAYDTGKSPVTKYDANKISDQIKALYKSGLTGGYMTWNSASSLVKYNDISEAFKEDYLNE